MGVALRPCQARVVTKGDGYSPAAEPLPRGETLVGEEVISQERRMLYDLKGPLIKP